MTLDACDLVHLDLDFVSVANSSLTTVEDGFQTIQHIEPASVYYGNAYSAEDEELRQAQEAYDKLAADARENEAKRMKLQLAPSIPKVMKNDIRRHYSRMFMNTINSADFCNMQNYFNTFMSGPCKFIADHVMIQTEFEIPSRIVADGPRLMAHYLLGCFVMYPDMTLTMHDSRIVTSNSWAGTKIVMDMEIHSTKMYDLDMDVWIPQLAALESRYQAALQESARIKAIADKAGESKSDTTVETTSSVDSTDPAGMQISALESIADPRAPLVREVSCESTDLNLFSDPLDDGIVPLTVPRVDPSTTSPGVNELVVEVSALAVPVTTPPTPAVRKGKKGGKKGTTTGTAGGTGPAPAAGGSTKSKRKTSDLEDTSSNDQVMECVPTSPQDFKHSHIPEAYVHALFAQAKLLPKALSLHLRGDITMYLDENNHIQHMNLNMEQRIS